MSKCKLYTKYGYGLSYVNYTWIKLVFLNVSNKSLINKNKNKNKNGFLWEKKEDYKPATLIESKISVYSNYLSLISLLFCFLKFVSPKEH